MRAFVTTAAVLLVIAAGLMWHSAAETKAQSKAENPWHLSAVIEKSVREIPGFMSATATTTIPKIKEVVAAKFGPMGKAAREAGVHFEGPAIFIYQGATGEMEQPFDLTMGMPVAADAKDVGEYKVAKRPGMLCVSAYYTGDISHLGEAWGKFYGQAMQRGVKPTGESREVYLFWEGEESPNNVIELQIAIERP